MKNLGYKKKNNSIKTFSNHNGETLYTNIDNSKIFNKWRRFNLLFK